jgi:hypothetical protein
MPKKHAEVTHKISVQHCGYLQCILGKRLIFMKNGGLLKKRCGDRSTGFSSALSTGNSYNSQVGNAQCLPHSIDALLIWTYSIVFDCARVLGAQHNEN